MPVTHEITLQQAVDLTSRCRNNKPSSLPLSETFEAAAIARLLSTTGCSYLRIYYGMKEDGNIVAILVAANEDNEDMLPAGTALTGDAVIVEEGIICPPICPPPSPLNT